MHIPFCVQKCLYCDFNSAPAAEATKEKYMRALLSEISFRAVEYGEYRVVSVFIGGGTPSAVKPEWIVKVMDCIREHFYMAQDAEITMEMNPGTVTARGLFLYKKAGINRLSIGLQSADNRELKTLGRIHTWEQFQKSYYLAREAGFSNINVDIMSALPGQTPASYHNTLQKVCGLASPPEHISAYSLIVEEGTPFAMMQERGALELVDEDTERKMYEETEHFLADRGYVRYEISNYAKAGYACRHNIGYWTRVSYVGFGVSAASLVEEVRFQNTADVERYIRNPLGCRREDAVLGEQDAMEEFMFLGLRMTRGVREREFEHRFGISMRAVYGEVIHKNIEDGLLEYHGEDTEDGARLALTSRGLDLSNYVMAQFLFSG